MRILQRCPEWLPKMLDPWVHDPLKIKLLHHENGLHAQPEHFQGLQDPGTSTTRPNINRAREIASIAGSDPGRHPVSQSGRALLRRAARRRAAALDALRQGRSRSGTRQIHGLAAGRRRQGTTKRLRIRQVRTKTIKAISACSRTSGAYRVSSHGHECPRARSMRWPKATLHPAIFAGYRDLTALRYDFPLVLVERAATRRRCNRCPRWSTPRSRQSQRRRRRTAAAARRPHRAGNPQAGRRRRDRLAVGALGRRRRPSGARMTTVVAGQPEAPARRAENRRRGHRLRQGDAVPPVPARLGSLQRPEDAKNSGPSINKLIMKLSDILSADFVRSKEGLSAERLQRLGRRGWIRTRSISTRCPAC